MALTKRDPNEPFWSAIGEDCFYCGEVIEDDPAVEWRGFADARFVLHPDCVLKLTIRLYRDLHELETVKKGRRTW